MADIAWLALVLLLGLAMSAWAYRTLRVTEKLRNDEIHAAAADSVMDSFTRDLPRAIEVVHNAGLMLEVNPQLRRWQFNHYAARVMSELHSVTILEWQPIVPAAELRQFEANARAEGLQNYRVLHPNPTGTDWLPAQGLSEYVPVLYAWPETSGTAGLDLAFSPERMASKRKSNAIGRPVASGVFEIMQNGTAHSGTMGLTISTAVRQDPTDPGRVRGYLAAVVPLPALLQDAAFRADSAKMDLLVYDLGSKDTKPIYTWLGDDSDLDRNQTRQREERRQDFITNVDVAGRPWEFVMHPRPTYFSTLPRSFAPLALAAGLASTLLIMLAVAVAQISRRRSEHAHALTQRAREALADERRRLNNIIEATDVGTWEYNYITGEVHANARWAGIAGYTLDELQPVHSYRWRDHCHPEDVARVTECLRKHHRGETQRYDCEYRVRHKDGRWVWLASRAKVIEFTADGKPQLIAGTNLEITARKQAEADVLALNATLEQRVQERTAQLESALHAVRHSQDQLAKSEAHATLGTLIASVSHELSTPMGNSLMAASALVAQAKEINRLVDLAKIGRAELTKFLSQVQDGNALVLRNLERAVDLLKNFRQVAADQASEQRRKFDMRQTVKEVIDTLAPSLKHSPHSVVQEVPAGITLDSYPGPLGQVIINLINNAYLHGFDGVARGQVTLHVEVQNEILTMTVHDNGKGISAQTLEKMFVPFFSTKIGEGGTGLGMSIVDNLVTKTLGGKVSVQSELGVGTTIQVTLPLSAPQHGGEN